jgi:hypothetical protein
MAKARWVLAALEREGVRQVWAEHDGTDLGAPRMAQIARRFGYTLDELRRLL